MRYRYRRIFEFFDPRPNGRGFVWRLRMFYQRGRYGVSVEDTWSFDDYLTRVIPRGITMIRDRDFGNPMLVYDENGESYLGEFGEAYDENWEERDPDGITAGEVWIAALTEMIDGFNAYSIIVDGYEDEHGKFIRYPSKEEHEALDKQAKFGMMLFVNNFPALWD